MIIAEQNCRTKATEKIPFIEIIMPYADKFISNCEAKLPDSLKDKLLLNLLVELSSFAELTLQYELDAFVKEGKDDLAGYNERISKSLPEDYPVLDRILKIKTRKFSKHISNIATRFQHDYEKIINMLNIEQARKIVEIINIDTSLGDNHNGEGTALVSLSNGAKLIYKPRNVSITNSYNIFIDWLNLNLQTNLKTFEVIDCENYGWLEFVNDEGVNSIKDLEGYYFKAGVLLSATFLLGSVDCHHENIIASGNSPVIIDHETIIQAFLVNQSFHSWDDQNKVPRSSVLESMLITNDGYGIPLNFTGYGINGMINVTELEKKVINSNTIKSKRVARFVTRNLIKKNIPICNGKYTFANEYKTSFIDGFTAAYDLFFNSKEDLKSASSPINSFKNKEIRYVWRPTFIYYKILQYMRSATYMSNFEVYRSKIHELLSKAYLEDHMKDYNFILNFEVDQMLDGEIPIFNFNSSDKVLYNNRSFKIFEFNCIENIAKRLDTLSPENKDNQIGFINDWLSIKL